MSLTVFWIIVYFCDRLLFSGEFASWIQCSRYRIEIMSWAFNSLTGTSKFCRKRLIECQNSESFDKNMMLTLIVDKLWSKCFWYAIINYERVIMKSGAGMISWNFSTRAKYRRASERLRRQHYLKLFCTWN